MNAEKKAMQVTREAMLTRMSSDEIADAARQLAPDNYGDIARLGSAPERARLLVQIAHRDHWLDKLSEFVFHEQE